MLDLTCPCCGAMSGLEAYLLTEAQGRAVTAALAMPRPVRLAVVGYMRLFNVQGRKATASKTARLIGELAEIIPTNQIKRAGNVYVITSELWRDAMDDVVERARQPGSTLRLPLKTHGYLYEVVAGKAEQLAARVESQREAARSTGGSVLDNVVRPEASARSPPPPPAPVDPGGKRAMSAEARQALIDRGFLKE
ncbi:hypothetical protein [Jeongeupia chitinilytica]|uniref:DUF721 domain-containing protein n=1 Tax=Jeongeupia chitinilytica TaxID=1041641 RepID=A0ABQ3H3Z3_9NEIS|nr:hypothetical protein [Jeongeupia chitinilytica]GHD63767.1 hypothetical protein GCM10007350_21910 [Jeongeupia chitinilytica]